VASDESRPVKSLHDESGLGVPGFGCGCRFFSRFPATAPGTQSAPGLVVGLDDFVYMSLPYYFVSMSGIIQEDCA
jgi:hypothetical protein